MTILAKIICDSRSPLGERITTMQVRYPRFIHGELMTHRVFSRNSSSSRAIPVKKVVEDVLLDPAMPIHWGKNIPGMQAKEEHDAAIFLPGDSACACSQGPYTHLEAWLRARDKAVEVARAFDGAGYHKQIVNRILEPFMHMNVCITSTNWSNFYALRRHEDAQPEIKALADAMYAAHQESVPNQLEYDQWHLPYVREDDIVAAREAVANQTYALTINPYVADHVTDLLIRVSVARCARTSYKLHDGAETTFEKDVGLYDRLLDAVPLHASPAEHQAFPDRFVEGENAWVLGELHGNFSGFVQYRKTLPGESQ
jgi:thymidylate synthase ThyX